MAYARSLDSPLVVCPTGATNVRAVIRSPSPHLCCLFPCPVTHIHTKLRTLTVARDILLRITGGHCAPQNAHPAIRDWHFPVSRP